MNQVTLSSRHKIWDSNPGGLKPMTLPLGHGGSTQYWIGTREREKTHFFLWVLEHWASIILTSDGSLLFAVTALGHRWLNDGPASPTLCQHWDNVGPAKSDCLNLIWDWIFGRHGSLTFCFYAFIHKKNRLIESLSLGYRFLNAVPASPTLAQHWDWLKPPSPRSAVNGHLLFCRLIKLSV